MDKKFEIFDADIKIPMSMVIAGPSKSGKSSFTIKLLKNKYNIIEQDFDYILWFYGQNEPKDQEFASDSRVSFIKGLPRSLDTYVDSSLNGVAIFDDLMTECGNSALMSDFFTKKCHHENISVIFITQNFFSNGKARKDIIKNANYIVLFNSPMDRSIGRHLASRILPESTKSFLQIYKHATAGPHKYLFIDGHQNTPPEAQFRTDILNYYQKNISPLD